MFSKKANCVRPAELEQRRLLPRLERGQHDERERDEEDDDGDDDRDDPADDVPADGGDFTVRPRFRLNQNSGRTIAVTTRNSTTLPAVERP